MVSLPVGQLEVLAHHLPHVVQEFAIQELVRQWQRAGQQELSVAKIFNALLAVVLLKLHPELLRANNKKNMQNYLITKNAQHKA